MKSLIHSLLSSNSSVNQASLASLAMRLPVGIIFIVHGAQKLFGWFGGYGLEGTGQWMASIGLAPGELMALMAGGAEFFGGIALILGLLTRFTGIVLAITMVVAITAVHWSHGLLMSNNGYEFALSLLAASIALFFTGGGRYSLDALLTKNTDSQSIASPTVA